MGGRTPLDHALNSRNAFLAFTGIVTAASAWAIWGQDLFPVQPDPTGDPATWTEPELRRWLTSPSPPEENSPGHSTCDSGQGHQEFEKERLNQETENQELIGTQRNLHPDPKATKEELVERVKANFRVPRA